MTTRIILIRHGNTFRPEDEPVWVGARTDLPLVEKGLMQAKAMGAALHQANIAPAAIITGPLIRTRQTAELIAEAVGFSPAAIRIDPRLTEIDYGTWEGKSTTAITAMGDEAELSAWSKNSIYPANAGWSPSEAQIIADTQSLLADAQEGTSILVSSNGILRFFGRTAVNAKDFIDRKVATGHLCILERDMSGNWLITKWNQPPERLTA